MLQLLISWPSYFNFLSIFIFLISTFNFVSQHPRTQRRTPLGRPPPPFSVLLRDAKTNNSSMVLSCINIPPHMCHPLTQQNLKPALLPDVIDVFSANAAGSISFFPSSSFNPPLLSFLFQEKIMPSSLVNLLLTLFVSNAMLIQSFIIVLIIPPLRPIVPNLVIRHILLHPVHLRHLLLLSNKNLVVSLLIPIVKHTSSISQLIGL